MKKIERLVSIVMIMLQKQNVSASEFSELFNVSKRTIQRDMEALSYAGIPIYAEYGSKGGYAIMEEYKFDKRLLNHNDIENILIALEGFEGLITNQEIRTTIQKIKGMTSKEIFQKVDLSIYDWIGRSQIKEEVLFIKNAIENNWLLKFEYIDKNGNVTYRVVEPYKLHLSEKYWYFIGYSIEREDYRTFKLTRMINIEKDGFFVPRNKKEFKEKNYGAVQKLFDLELLIDLSVRDQFIERYGKKVITKITASSYRARIQLPDNQYSYQFIASFGNKVRILKPKIFVVNYLKFLNETMNLYK